MNHASSGQAAPRPAEPASHPLSSSRGVWILLLLCAVQFMDVLDASIVNVALPSMERDLGFTQQSLQWVVSGYVLMYGGFLLLGSRVADLLGRRRVLLSGLALFSISSLVGGLSQSAELLVGARFAQGLGAAILSPAALSLVTTTFRSGRDRNVAMGAWGAISGLGAAAGVLFGGLLTEGPGWRWVLFVNVPICVIAFAGALALLPGERRPARLRGFDLTGAVLVTGGMLLLVYALVEAPDVGWSASRTILELAGAGALLGAFALNEVRAATPLIPLSILRVRGLAAADATQLLIGAGFIAMFFFLTLYMQTVLNYSPIEAGLADLPVTAGVIVAAAVASQLFARIGTKPVIVAGSLIGTAGLALLSRIPVDGSYVPDLLPGLVLVGVGLGAAFVAITTAANAGVGEDRAGLAAGLLNTSLQLGGALGLAILSAVATSRTDSLLRAGDVGRAFAVTEGFQRALVVAAAFALAAAVVALLARNIRQTGADESPVPAARPPVRARPEDAPATAVSSSGG